jgi:Flp pilus assembly protein CpaB
MKNLVKISLVVVVTLALALAVLTVAGIGSRLVAGAISPNVGMRNVATTSSAYPAVSSVQTLQVAWRDFPTDPSPSPVPGPEPLCVGWNG